MALPNSGRMPNRKSGPPWSRTARPGMKFIIVFIEWENNGDSSQKPPGIGGVLGCESELIANDGSTYPIWLDGWAHKDKNRRPATKEEVDKLIGTHGGYDPLRPGESSEGVTVFEIPTDLIPVKLELEIGDNIYNIDIPESSIVDETTIKDTMEEPRTQEETREEFKNIVIEIIEEGFGGRLTKFTVSDDFTDMTVSYNTRWASEDRVKKEMYDITTLFSGTEIPVSLELTATTDMGTVFVAYTDSETMRKIRDYEIDYNEWLSIAF